jgi:hypothetical protein
MEGARERVILPVAAERLGVTMKDVLHMIDREEIDWEFDRTEGRFFIPADQLPD